MENKLRRTAPQKPEEFSQWQKLLNEIADLAGLTLVAYDSSEFLLDASRPNPICDAIQQKREGIHLCEQDCGNMLSQSAKGGPLRVFKCHAHLFNFAVPIYRDGKVEMVLLGGRVFQNYQDFTRFSRQSSKYALQDYIFVDWENALKFQGGQVFEQTARLIQSIADSVSNQSPWAERINRRSFRLDTLYELSGLISMESSPDKAYQLILDAMAVLFEIQECVLLQADEEVEHFRLVRGSGSLLPMGTVLDLSAQDLYKTLKEGRAHLCEETYHILKMGYPDGVRSIRSFPVFSEGQLTAVLQIFNTSPSDEVLQLLLIFCRHLGISLENLRLRQEVRDHLTILTALDEMLATAMTQPVSRAFYQGILLKILEVMQAEQGSLVLLDESTACLVVKAIQGINEKIVERLRIRPGEGIAGRVFQEGVPLLVRDMANDARFQGYRRSRYKTGSFLCMPIHAGPQRVGVLNISDRVDGRPFEKRDLVRMGALSSHVAMALDKAGIRQRMEDAARNSTTDSLTGLHNRKFLLDRLSEEIERGRRYGHTVSFIMLDLDDFKRYNDSYGTRAGDEALKMTANLIRASLRNIDIAARYGGEEFSILLPMTAASAAEVIAERIRSSIAGQYFPDQSVQLTAKLTLSLGIGSFPGDASGAQELIGNADRALFMAKTGGKNRLVVFDKTKGRSVTPGI